MRSGALLGGFLKAHNLAYSYPQQIPGFCKVQETKNLLPDSKEVDPSVKILLSGLAQYTLVHATRLKETLGDPRSMPLQSFVESKNS